MSLRRVDGGQFFMGYSEFTIENDDTIQLVLHIPNDVSKRLKSATEDEIQTLAETFSFTVNACLQAFMESTQEKERDNDVDRKNEGMGRG